MGQNLSIFDLGYFENQSEAQEALNKLPTEGKKFIHVPSFSDVSKIQQRLQNKALESNITNLDILLAYQELDLSASTSDIICVEVVSGNKCGGLIDLEVSAFGRYYQCRRNSIHRFPA